MPDLPHLAREALTLSQARGLGLTDRQWRDPQLSRITRGVRAATAPTALPDRCRAFATVLPDDVVFSHLTAARLWGLPLPRAAQEVDGFDVMRETHRPVIERSECRGHRGLERRETALVAGLRVTGLADTWVDLAEVSGEAALTVDDLVVVADDILMKLAERLEVRPGEEEWEAVLRRDWEREAGARPDRRDRLTQALTRRTRPRGAARLRVARDLARVGSRSPMETTARLLVVRRGFPEPELNAAVIGDAGWLLEGDLVWRAAKVIGEYQGEHHGGRRQRSLDVARRSLAEDEGWQMVEFWAEDIHAPMRRRAMLRRLAAKLGLDPASVDLS